jgi:hypothetical protein
MNVRAFCQARVKGKELTSMLLSFLVTSFHCSIMHVVVNGEQI